jgi:hypothetical protein
MKTILVFSFVFFFSLFSKADQLAYISKSQADKAVKFLENKNELLLWCACCENDQKRKIKVTSVYAEFVNYQHYFQVILEGVEESGKKVRIELDLAYVHFKKGKKAKCVGKALKFKCDPCTKAFDW